MLVCEKQITLIYGHPNLNAARSAKTGWRNLCILSTMKCPKCKHDMEAIEYEGVEVDRCKSCKGIWFDVGESEWLFGEDAANAIDTGDPSVGQRTNQIDRYRCPRCDGGMMRRTEPKKKQIKYEECSSCRGMFFDAGEFTGLVRDAVSALLKQR